MRVCFVQKLYKAEALLSGTMSTKKCCYMNKGCTSECVAYSDANELSEMAETLGLDNMHCIRLLTELSNMMNTVESMGFEDFEDFEDEDEF